MVLHSKNVCHDSENSCGSLAFSPDSFTWYTSPDPVYNSFVEWDDGTNETLASRQRPKIFFSDADEGGGRRPLFLLNGAESSRRPGEQFTMAQPFRQH